MPSGGRRVPGPGKQMGRPPKPGLPLKSSRRWSKNKVACVLCVLNPAAPAVVDTDDLRKKIRGLVHRKCQTFLVLGRDNPLRFQRAITYLERKGSPSSEPPQPLANYTVPKSP